MTFTIPKEGYLTKPEKESCYEYMLACYSRISKDLGDNYTAFVTPVANTESEIKMKKLLSDIEKLSAFLYSKGIRKGDVITAFLPTCGHGFTVFYALSKIGAISNFVHPLTPPGQLLGIMKHTKSKGIFLLDLFAGAYKSVIDEYMTVVCSVSDYCNPEDLAYKYAKGNEMQNAHVPESENIVLFGDILNMDLPDAPTNSNPYKDDAIYLHGGGTTGRSKTIIHSAFSFNTLAYSMYALDPEHDYTKTYSLCVLPCFHAYGLGVSMHYALCNAYKPIVISKFDPIQANDLVSRYCINEILGVPKMFEKMFEAPNFENEGVKNFQVISMGGDKPNMEFVKKFNEKITQLGAKTQIATGYGLTEMCAVCTTNNLPADEYRADTIGKPIMGVTIEIWDEDCNKLPVGEIGEIVVRGDTMMNRYLPDDFIQESGIYTDANGVDWVRTGDVAYYSEDGHINFASRIKRIIIIAGYNIYPATIEEKVLELDYIAEACAVQGYDEKGKPYVKLCVALKDQTLDAEEVKSRLLNYCKANIEGYGCPRKVEILEALPRTKMEKIDFVKLSDAAPAV